MHDPEEMAGEYMHRMLSDKTRRYDGTRNWFRVVKRKHHPKGHRRETMDCLVLMLGMMGQKYEIRHATHFQIRLKD